MLKKMSLWAIIMLVMIVLAGDVSFAAERTVDGDLTYEEGANVYVETEKDILLDQEKIAAALKSRALGSTNKKLNMTVFVQSNKYYCGPASVKMVLHYLNGASSSQDAYATQLQTTSNGTDMTLIPGVLNNNQNKFTYIYKTINNYSEWQVRMLSAIQASRPAILDIESTTDNWKYQTDGHFLCVSGFNDTGSVDYVYISDPHYTYYGTRLHEAEDAYAVNAAHFRHAIIY